jgi:hypothetical protein
MEHLFSPCTRLHDTLESQGRVHLERLLELKLNVSADEFLSAKGGLHTRTYTRCWETEIRLRG